ncbi:MAG: DUF2442 domain-containing protein [Candidatus Margulisbacteria bacterium]|jgi:hypothetical protein|nr:DUF2442 domain-containing protein [Candidatus Margulisiibacteriota bacterium]
MFHKVKKVKALPDHCLLVQFEKGERKQYDLKPLFKEIEAFQPLTYVTGLFEQVKVDAGGYGISWNDDIDLACDELYNNGTKVSNIQPTTNRFGGRQLSGRRRATGEQRVLLI